VRGAPPQYGARGRSGTSKLSNLQLFSPAWSTSFHHRSPTSSRPETFLTVQKSMAERMVTTTKVSTYLPRGDEAARSGSAALRLAGRACARAAEEERREDVHQEGKRLQRWGGHPAATPRRSLAARAAARTLKSAWKNMVFFCAGGIGPPGIGPPCGIEEPGVSS
jgi:hypothetical protein